MKISQLLTLLVFCFVCIWGGLQYSFNVYQYLPTINVLIEDGEGSSSGAVYTRTTKNGDNIHFVWASAHGISGILVTDTNINSPTIKTNELALSIPKFLDGVEVSRVKYFSQLLAYDNKEDLALLILKDRNAPLGSINFTTSKISVGTPLFNVGSPYGEHGISTITKGMLSQIGRPDDDKEYDVASMIALPGISGSAVCIENGLCVGIALRNIGGGFLLMYAPSRRIEKWAKKMDILWAFDKTVPLPERFN